MRLDSRTSRIVLMVASVGMAFAIPLPSAGGTSVQTRETQAAMTPDEALRLLRAGNERFASGVALQRDLSEQVRDTSAGQYPFAAVLGCIDSRVPPELVFDTGIGDVFSARIAGNALDDELLGSLEFATKAAGARLIVVLGHTRCGAVLGACDGVEMGHLTKTLKLLAPAIEASRELVPAPHDSSNAAFVQHVTEQNVRLTAKALLERSEILAGLAKEGQLRVVPAVYDVATGAVRFLE
jgi:carbonic anhydrase